MATVETALKRDDLGEDFMNYLLELAESRGVPIYNKK